MSDLRAGLHPSVWESTTNSCESMLDSLVYLHHLTGALERTSGCNGSRSNADLADSLHLRSLRATVENAYQDVCDAAESSEPGPTDLELSGSMREVASALKNVSLEVYSCYRSRHRAKEKNFPYLPERRREQRVMSGDLDDQGPIYDHQRHSLLSELGYVGP